MVIELLTRFMIGIAAPLYRLAGNVDPPRSGPTWAAGRVASQGIDNRQSVGGSAR